MEELPLLLYILSDMIHIQAKTSRYRTDYRLHIDVGDHDTTGGLSCAFI